MRWALAIALLCVAAHGADSPAASGPLTRRACPVGQSVTSLYTAGGITCAAGGGGGGAPTGALYWTGAADATLSAEKNLGALVTGLVLNTGGVPSTYAGASCAYAVKTVNADGSVTCTAAPSIPADLSAEPFITKTASANLSNEFALGSLATGLLKNTAITGVPTIAVAGTDFAPATPSSGVLLKSDGAGAFSLYGGSNCAVGGQYATSVTGGGAWGCAQVAYSQLSGVPPAAGSNTQVQYNNAGVFGGMANFTADASGYASVPGATAPTAPSSGAKLYADDRGGMSWPAFLTEQGAAHYVDRADWAVDKAIMLPGKAAAGTTVPQTLGLTLATAVGTISNPNPTNASVRGGTTFITLTSAAVASSAAEWKSAQNNWFRGDATAAGGFLFVWRGRFQLAPANLRNFIGLQGGVAALAATSNPSAFLTSLYFGNDAGQATVRFCGNDAVGAATCTDCGVNFPSNNGAAYYEFSIFAKANDTAVYFYGKRIDSAATCSGSITVAGDLPANALFLSPHLWCSNGGTASSCAIDTAIMYLEKDY